MPKKGMLAAYNQRWDPDDGGVSRPVCPVVLRLSWKLVLVEPKVTTGGVNVKVTPLGNPLQESVVGSVVIPVLGAIVIGYVAVWPAATVCAGGGCTG